MRKSKVKLKQQEEEEEMIQKFQLSLYNLWVVKKFNSQA
jgi:CRISPR/Cas system-associated exonuclease Cas4 (RecB family)